MLPSGGRGADVLTADEKAHYDEQGWVRLQTPFGPEACARLRDELTLLCRGGRGPVPGATGPTGPEVDEATLLARHVALHFPHKLSPVVRAHLHEPWVAGVFSAVLGPDVKVVQSMFFIRPPGGPGQAWHQDERFVPTRDQSLVGLWLALEPATVEGGCLWVLPGSHRPGVLWPHRPHHSPRFDPVDAAVHPLDEGAAVPLPCAAGEALLFHGHLLHRSLDNRSTGFRRALALHAVRARSRMPWMGAEARGPIGEADCRDFELIAGVDPYADEPREDRLLPWLRPARL